MALVAISGSQGSGKTTILNRVKNHQFPIIERKTSRSILAEWEVTLEQVNNDPDLTVKFQEEIIERKYNDEISHSETNKGFSQTAMATHTWFTERTFADLFTYAVVTLGKDNRFSDWLNEYYRRCMRYNQIYDQVYYLKAGHFTPAHDGTRGSNVHYSRMVDLTMLDITQQMTHNSKLTVIDAPDLEQRVTLIAEQAKALL